MKQTVIISQIVLWFSCMLQSSVVFAEPTQKDHDEMRFAYHELDMANEKTKQETGISLELSELEMAYAHCLGKDSDLVVCKKDTAALQEKLHSQSHDAQMLAEEKKQTELLKQQAEAAKTPSTTNVTIIERRIDDDDWYHRHTHDKNHPQKTITPVK